MAYRANTYRRRRPATRRSVRRSYTPRRRTPARRMRAAVRRRRSPMSVAKSTEPRTISPGEKYVLAQIDPFSNLVEGAKIPDSNTIPSVAAKDTELTNVALAVSTNVACTAFLPSYACAFVVATEGAGSWSWPAAFGSAFTRGKNTAYTNEFVVDRPVAHGIRLSSSVAPTSATGYVHIAIAVESNRGKTTWSWPTTVSGMSGYQHYKRVTIASLTQEPLIVVNKFTDETAYRYSDTTVSDENNPSANSAFSIPLSWGAILVAIEGANVINPISAEHVLLTEAIPKKTGAVRGTMAAPTNYDILAGAGHASATTPPTRSDSQGEAATAAAAQRLSQVANDLYNRAVDQTIAYSFEALMGLIPPSGPLSDNMATGHSTIAPFQTINTQTLQSAP